MAVVMLIFAVGLTIAAVRTRDRALRWFWSGAAALNLIAAMTMIGSQDSYAFKLRPDVGDYERDYRR